MGTANGAESGNEKKKSPDRGERVAEKGDGGIPSREALGHDARTNDDGEKQGGAEPFGEDFLKGKTHGTGIGGALGGCAPPWLFGKITK